MNTYYITIFLVAIFGSIAQKSYTLNNSSFLIKNNKISVYSLFVILTAFILIFVSSFRYNVGTDYFGYVTGYNTRVLNVWKDIQNFDEPGLGIIAYISKLLRGDYLTMFILASIITIGLNIKTISKHSKMFAFSVLLYIFIGAWHGSFNGMRQYLAAAVLFSGHRHMIDRKLLKWCVVVFIAMLFHMTALIMFPVYFIVRWKPNLKTVILIAIATILMRFSYDYFFEIMSTLKGKDQSKYEYMQTSVKSLRVLVAYAPLVLILIIPKKLRENSENSYYINLLLINAAFLFATSGSAYLARVGIYTDIYATIAYPRIIGCFRKKDGIVLKVVILLFYFAFWFYEVSSRVSLNDFKWIFSVR